MCITSLVNDVEDNNITLAEAQEILRERNIDPHLYDDELWRATLVAQYCKDMDTEFGPGNW